MTITEYSIKHKVISWMFICILLVGGTISFTNLGQLEMPEFTIKQALISTSYPGASPEQVEEEVTLPLENAIQQLPGIDFITSISSAGLSQITLTMHPTVPSSDIPQVWDELRRKIRDQQIYLPPGVEAPLVMDDFGDVYGIFVTITGQDYNYRELQNYAEILRRELVLVEGVKRVDFAGTAAEMIVVELDPIKTDSLSLDPNLLYGLIRNQNVVANAGTIFTGTDSVRIHPTGEWNAVEDLKNLVISQPGSEQLIHLADIAKIYRSFDEAPVNIYRTQGARAIAMGISFTDGVNVVDVGKRVSAKLDELDSRRPYGMEIHPIYNQSELVEDSVQGFVMNLVGSVIIVIVVLLLFMGLRSGLLMGLILLLTILGTFIVMAAMDIQLELISLGALIIALGMLVDNAIVITEGILIGIKRGYPKLEAAKRIVTQTQWPLLGATLIAIIAFAPIGLSPDDVGEFCRSLFTVLCISLLISWLTALTLTPFLANLWFPENKQAATPEEIDPYQGIIFTLYKWLLNLTMRFRGLTMLVVFGMLVGAVIGFGNVKNSFFPPSNTPMFYIDIWTQEGSDIRATEQYVDKLERAISEEESVVQVTSTIGAGAMRFALPYQPEMQYASYAQLLVTMNSLDEINAYLPDVYKLLERDYADVDFRVRYANLGPSPAGQYRSALYG